MTRDPAIDEPGENPLRSGSPREWDRLVEAVGPASMLVNIGARMSDDLASRHSAEDVWQETLMHAWRDRERLEWRGVPGFRRWLLSIAENRIRDLLDRETALKRGGGAKPLSLAGLEEASGGDAERASEWAGPSSTTTPSRSAMASEQATAMCAALDSLEETDRQIVRLRLFEDLTMLQVARRIGMTESGVRHRFRKAAALYHRTLEREMGTRIGGTEPNPRRPEDPPPLPSEEASS